MEVSAFDKIEVSFDATSGFESNNWFLDSTDKQEIADEYRPTVMTSDHEKVIHITQSHSTDGDTSDGNQHDILSASTQTFDGICLDFGASFSVVGNQQYELYCEHLGYKPEKQNSESRFKFGISTFIALFKFTCRLGLPDDKFMEFTVHVVEGNFTLLMGLEVIRQYGLRMDWGRNILSGSRQYWRLPIQYAYGHAFVHNYQNTILFTRAELERLHLHFHHPSTDKLFNLIRRVDPTKVDSSIKKVFDVIASACGACKQYSTGLLSFCASMPPDDLVFNHEVAVDLVWVNKIKK